MLLERLVTGGFAVDSICLATPAPWFLARLLIREYWRLGQAARITWARLRLARPSSTARRSAFLAKPR